MAADKEISVDAAVAALISELKGIFTLKKNIKNGPEGFSGREKKQQLWTGFGESSIKRCGGYGVPAWPDVWLILILVCHQRFGPGSILSLYIYIYKSIKASLDCRL